MCSWTAAIVWQQLPCCCFVYQLWYIFSVLLSCLYCGLMRPSVSVQRRYVDDHWDPGKQYTGNKLCAPALLNLSKSPDISCLWGTIFFGREQSFLNKQDITRCGFVGIYREARAALKQWLGCVCVGELLQVPGRCEIWSRKCSLNYNCINMKASRAP